MGEKIVVNRQALVMCPWARAPPAKSAPWNATATSRPAAHNYDNMKTAVNTVFVGKEREYNERFLQMCSHHLVEPVACTPGAGWEKGQVENQVGTARGRLFVPRPRGRSYRELNTWLVEQCIGEAKRCRHPTIKDKTVWQVFEEERAYLMAYRGPFDGFHSVQTNLTLAAPEVNRFEKSGRMPPSGSRPGTGAGSPAESSRCAGPTGSPSTDVRRRRSSGYSQGARAPRSNPSSARRRQARAPAPLPDLRAGTMRSRSTTTMATAESPARRRGGTGLR